MGTEVEVKNRLSATKEAFLSLEDESGNASAQKYTLESAFRQTEKNSSPRLIIAIVMMIFVLISASAAFHYYMRTLENSVEINIAEFEDVRLKEALFSIGNTSMELDLLQAEVRDLDKEHASKVADLTEEYNRLEKLSVLKGETHLIDGLKTQEQMEIAKIEEEWRTLKEEKLKAIARLEDKNTSVQKQLAGSKADVLNPEQKLQSLQVRKVQEHYEERISELRADFQQQKKDLILKYNPHLNDSGLESITNQSIEPPKNEFFTDEQLMEFMQTGVITTEQIKELEQVVADQQLLVNRLRAIPFVNLPQVVTERLYSFNQAVIGQFVGLANNLNQILEAKSGEVGSYSFMMSDMVARAKSDGLIVDPRDARDIVVFFREDYFPKKGDQYEVYRYETPLGVRVISDIDKGKVVIRSSKEGLQTELMPFDKLLLIEP
ncbi:MAG: hypothetical protein ACRBB6_06245 [Neptuniibacter sp.]